MKFILTLVLSLLGYFSYAQYPTTKVVDGQEVVIMTVQQADEVNELFLQYSDSIKSLNEKIWRLGYDIRFAEKQIEALDGTLGEVKAVSAVKDNEISFYKKEMKRIEKLEWIDRRVKRNVGIGLGIVLISWASLFILSK